MTTHAPAPAIAIVGLGIHGRRIAALADDAGFRILAAADPALAGQRLHDATADARSLAGDAGSLDTAHGSVTTTAGPAATSRVEASTATLASPVVVASFDAIDPAVLAEVDVVVVAAQMPPAPLYDLIVSALERGTNVLTIVEHLFEPSLLPTEVRERIDAAAYAGGVSFVATGAQDVVWSGVVAHLTGAVRQLRGIEIVQRLGVDGYPEPFLVHDVAVTSTAETWPTVEAGLLEQPPVLGGILPTLARQLGLTAGTTTRTLTPVPTDRPLPSLTFGRDLLPGEHIGVVDEVRLDTAEGITLSASLETTAVQPGEGNDVYEARIDAMPTITLRHEMEPGPENVNAVTIHRVPHVVAARSGIVTIDELPMPVYRPLPR